MDGSAMFMASCKAWWYDGASPFFCSGFLPRGDSVSKRTSDGQDDFAACAKGKKRSERGNLGRGRKLANLVRQASPGSLEAHGIDKERWMVMLSHQK